MMKNIFFTNCHEFSNSPNDVSDLLNMPDNLEDSLFLLDLLITFRYNDSLFELSYFELNCFYQNIWKDKAGKSGL